LWFVFTLSLSEKISALFIHHSECAGGWQSVFASPRLNLVGLIADGGRLGSSGIRKVRFGENQDYRPANWSGRK
jgi:hypothetical protein